MKVCRHTQIPYRAWANPGRQRTHGRNGDHPVPRTPALRTPEPSTLETDDTGMFDPPQEATAGMAR